MLGQEGAVFWEEVMPRRMALGTAASLSTRANFYRRRRFLARLAGAGSLALLPGRLRADSQEIRFGLTPVLLSSDLELLTRLKAYLTASVGRPVELVTRRTYQEITAMLLSGYLDAAWICGYPYVQYRDRLSLIAVPVWRGRPMYQSYLIVDRDRPVAGVDDLRGDIHAFSDPDSNSGFLVTQALLADMAETPSTYFRKMFFTYSHRDVVRAVASGLAESGSVDGYVWEVMSEIEPDLTSKTRILRKSEWLGFPPVACAKAVHGKPTTERITRALLAMGDDSAGRQVLDMLRLDGFTPGDDDLFRGIAQKYDQVRRLG
jgi:phosphonate transport system substrate-binding protein